MQTDMRWRCDCRCGRDAVLQATFLFSFRGGSVAPSQTRVVIEVITLYPRPIPRGWIRRSNDILMADLRQSGEHI